MTRESWKFLQHSFLEELERTVALLAFEDVSNCPVGDLLDISQRLKTASEVNAAILTSQSHEKGLRMSISFLIFFYFFICLCVCVNRNKCSCVLGWCLLLFVFISFLCPKRKKREERNQAPLYCTFSLPCYQLCHGNPINYYSTRLLDTHYHSSQTSYTSIHS